jgi:hypothetical protein
MLALSKQYEHMVNSLDRSLFKARDLPVLEKVLSYLNSHGVDVNLDGSVARNAINGNPRHYKDIDLLVPKKSSGVDALIEIYQQRNPLSLQGIEVEYLGRNFQYINTNVSHRFRISRGKTVIDLCFEAPNNYFYKNGK